MTTDEIAKYATTTDGQPWIPWARLSKQEKAARRRKADVAAAKWRKAVDENPDAAAYYSELARGRQ